ncbi:MAG: signal peptidase II [bacterium]|nr:signal peptidase II [bacterium]
MIISDQFSRAYVLDTEIAYQKNSLFILGLVNLNKWVYLLLVVVFVWFLIKNFQQNKGIFQKITLLFIVSGVISQAISRIWYGNVIDFINILNVTYVNLADLYIVCGVVVFFIYSSISKVERGTH